MIIETTKIEFPISVKFSPRFWHHHHHLKPIFNKNIQQTKISLILGFGIFQYDCAFRFLYIFDYTEYFDMISFTRVRGLLMHMVYI